MSVFASIMPNYAAAAILLSFGGLLNGYDTGSIGAIVHMAQFTTSMGALSPLARGMTVSAIMLTGVIPSFFAGQLADKYGRLRVIAPGALVFCVGAVFQAAATGLPQFIAGRAVAGFGQGVFLGNVTVYIAEVAPARRRGRLAALPQFMATLGICVGYFSCFGTAGIDGDLAWRLPYAVPVACSLMLALGCRLLPEPPRWLALSGRGDEAQDALRALNVDVDEARRDFLTAAQDRPSLSDWQSFVLLFRRGYRSQTWLALFMLSMVQLSGIDAITYYAPALFSQAGISSDKTSLVASGVSSITMLLVSIPGFLLADRWGRRTAAISGGVLLSGLMFLMGSLYAAGAVRPQSAANWVVAVCVFLFGMVFCATWGITGRIYASEILPGNTRAAANQLGMAFSYFTNWLVALITPILLDASAFGAYFLFGALTMVGVVIFIIFMPETRGRSLEDIQIGFQRPAQTMMSTLFRRWGLGRRDHEGSPEASLPSDGHELTTPSAETPEASDGAVMASSVSVASAARGLRVAAV